MANVTDKVAIIRNATYGNEVREGIASGIENINTEVISTTAKQAAQEIAYNSTNAFVTDALVSTVKNKTFTTVRNRFEEQETNSYFPAKNIITNGNFDTTTSPWAISVATAGNTLSAIKSVLNNKLIIDFPVSTSHNLFFPFGRIIGHKYYGRITYERLAGSLVGVDAAMAGVGIITPPDMSTLTVLSAVTTAVSVGGSALQMGFYIPTVDTKIAISKPLFIDLTATFGVGNEPNTEEIESILAQFPSSWFDGTVQIANIKQLMLRNIINLRKKMEQSDLDNMPVVPGTVSINDLDASKNVTYKMEKQNNQLKISWDITTDAVTLNSIAYGSTTYSQLFVDKNIITNSNFSNDLTGYTVSTVDSPSISTDVFNTPSKCMKMFGTTSRYVVSNILPSVIGNKYFVACRVRLDRYISGGGVGFQINNDGYAANRAINKVTSGFDTVSNIYTNVENPESIVLGTMKQSNADAYIDDFMIIDITDMPNSLTQTSDMVKMYEAYLNIVNGVSPVLTITKDYKFITEEKTLIIDEDKNRAFMLAMNEKAEEIGMTNSFFNNPAGADYPDHTVTPRDLVLMGIHASGYNKIVKVWNKKDYAINIMGISPRTIDIVTSVTDPLLENFYYIFGGKTGTTGVVNLLVLVNAPNNNWFVGSVIGATGNRFEIAKNMFDIAKLYMTEGYSGTHDISATGVAVALMPSHNPLAYAKRDIPLLWGKNEDVQNFPASITKIMTAMVMLDYVDDMYEKITIQSSDIMGGSGPTFIEGDILTLKDALYAMLLPSSNTCASAVCRTIGEKIIRSKQ